ncbi:hypothetical protein [Saccharothrix obliqua]|uniref:hypothetical protein n=1 Tax=Saccharothrix obliqua TaxID=2861747 RepID=UPI001C5F7451|nr:hypothetical protein [Saccharothrix obliqua]MBW4716055.1 hypothetical protein [Saccharothrix obliqua]
MQRPTTSGRRHNRAGSVSVAELIRKQRPPLRAPARGRAGAPATEPAHLAPPPPTNRTAKVAGLATGAAVFLAFTTTAALLASHRDAGPEPPAVAPPAAIAGSSALRPDVLAAELGGPPVRAQPPAADEVPLELPMEPDRPVVPPQEAASRSKPQVDVVRQFYELLPAKPADAARLLTPELVGPSTRDFAASWSGVQAITTESTALRPDGTVLAVVSMQERSGRWLRVEQRFSLTDTSPPRIVDTEVVSAQRG